LLAEIEIAKLNPSQTDGEMSVKDACNFWSDHLAAIERQVIATSA
jgi:hypothetical protein